MLDQNYKILLKNVYAIHKNPINNHEIIYQADQKSNLGQRISNFI
jgi:hypothetical protein